MPRKKPPLATVKKVVTFAAEPDGRYGVVSCSWREKGHKTRITREAAEKVAEGWKAEFVVEAAW